MQAAWRLIGFAVIVFAIALAAERLLVPGVVPVGYADEPQATWAVQTAFVLRTIELISAQVAVIAVAITLVAVARRWLRRRAT